MLPASSAATAISAWNWLGVVTDTTSTAGSLTNARQSGPERAKPNSPARRAARASVTSDRWASRTSGRSPNTA